MRSTNMSKLLPRLLPCIVTPEKLPADTIRIERAPTAHTKYSLSHSLIVRIRSNKVIEKSFASGGEELEFLSKPVAFGDWRGAICVVEGSEDEIPLRFYGKATWGDLLQLLYSRVHPTNTSADNVKEVMGEHPEGWYEYWTVYIFLLVGDKVVQGGNK